MDLKMSIEQEIEHNCIKYVARPEVMDCHGCDADSSLCDREDNHCASEGIIWIIKKETMQEAMQEPKSALDKQVGSNHYKLTAIQPVEYIYANNLSFCEGNVVKYITRHRNKNKEEDVRKALHYCQLILKLEYGLDE